MADVNRICEAIRKFSPSLFLNANPIQSQADALAQLCTECWKIGVEDRSKELADKIKEMGYA